MPYGRDPLQPIAEDLASRGYAAWNLEYRRLGSTGGGWPGTFDDVIAGIEHLTRIVAGGTELDLARVAVVGHSAGGHLALWSAARGGSVRIKAVVALAPVADLLRAEELGLGGRAVNELLGGTPAEHPERYQAASPRHMLPLGVPQLVIHGTVDSAVPIEIARSYVRAAQASGDRAELLELDDTGHMEFLEPGSAAHAALCDALVRLL